MVCLRWVDGGLEGVATAPHLDQGGGGTCELDGGYGMTGAPGGSGAW